MQMVCHELFLTMLLYDHQISVIAQNFVLVTASASSQLAPSFQALLLLRLYTACMHRCLWCMLCLSPTDNQLSCNQLN